MDMVQCDDCDMWSHFACVGVTQEVENQSWVCHKCQTAKDTQQHSTTSHRRGLVSLEVSAIEERLLNPKPSSVDRNPQKQQRSNIPKVVVVSASEEGHSAKAQQSNQKPASSNASLHALLKLQLMKLEEERAFEEEQARKHRDYLKEKYALLEQMSNHTCSNRSESSGRVRNWVEEVNGFVIAGNLADGATEPFIPKGHSTINGGKSAAEHHNGGGRSDMNSAHRNKITHNPPTTGYHNLRSRGPQLVNPNSTPLYGERSSDRIPAKDYQTRAGTSMHALQGVWNNQPNQSVAHQSNASQFNSVGNHPSQLQQPTWHNTSPPSHIQLASRQAVSKDLPLFSGNPEDWPIFVSTFESSTAMCGYSNEENMIRLQRCLKGKAYEAVKSSLMHPTNVTNVMNTLRVLYGQPEAIIHSLIVKINTIPTIKEDKPELLVDLAVKVQNFCATVDACGLEDYMYNVSLLHQLVNKLPATLKLEWARHRLTLPRVNLATFGEWIFSLAEAASILTIPTELQQHNPTKTFINSSKKTSTYLHTHSELPIGNEDASKSSKESSWKKPTNNDNCPVCNGKCKSVSNCKRFLQFSRDDRWAAVREFTLCRRCLSRHEGKCDTKPCGKAGCTFYHHELLHNDKKFQNYTSNNSTPTVHPGTSPAGPSNVHGCNEYQSAPNAVLFRYLPVTLYGNGKSTRTYAFLDEGSAITLIDQELADQLELEGPINPLCLRWTGGTERNETSSRTVNVKIAGIQAPAKQFQLNGVRTVKELMLPFQSLNMEEIALQYPHCLNLPIESYSNVRPRILIGLKHARVSLVLKSKEGSLDQPIAVKTRLGWTICGGCGTKDTSNFVHYAFHVCECRHQTDEDVHQMVKEYFAIDSLGIMKLNKDPLSTEDQRAISLLQTLTKYNGERYETGLLWRYDGVRLPDSKEMALRRYLSLEKRMQKSPELGNALQKLMSEYLAKGYVRKLSEKELNRPYPRVWYLPIFPVFNPNKPGKIRIVWDGAAKSFGVSLNSALLTGPDQLCSLFAILLQFREFRVGLTGDIKEMFHQIRMREEDQQCLRFFWKDEAGDTQIYVMNVMSFGASCSPASAQYVKNINADRFIEEFPEAVEVIKKRHYVDDAMFSVETPEHAIRLAQEVRQLHSAGGFEVRNWVSNSQQVLAVLNESNTSEKNMDLSAGPMATEKVLGMWWCTSSDEFVYKIGWNRYNPDLLTGRRRPTKRQMLQVLMTIFDPLGLIAHFLMYLKVLLQEVWRANVQWDEEIPNPLFEKWRTWLLVLPKVESVRIPRCLRTSTILSDCEVQLHLFVDASENGIAAASFLRFEREGRVCCSLVAAKTRVAPLRYHSIPRLELQAALIGARLARTVTQSLSTQDHCKSYWTDSRDVLSWINSDHRRYSTFVACRVSEILDLTEAPDWRWVPSKLNVADDGTKWETEPNMTQESRWFRGPEFLYLSEKEWPKDSSKSTHTDNELRPSFMAHHYSPKTTLVISAFLGWSGLRNAVAYAQRFIANCKRKQNRKPKLKGPLSRDELYAAEGFLFRLAQQEGYTDEMIILTNNHSDQTKTLPRSSPLYKLSPWIDDRGVMRMRS
ncbi:uncharacterized protein LOC129728484 [Wyeomyia smithii]|uniref:uncharacterized protein LOC129728484 n=1 Tax=Wyeomyia smithii TaxID=174621 RepID=UPI002467BAE9|nr:uncharacterized protein LOC129728484 [Wyeomyia smithii]